MKTFSRLTFVFSVLVTSVAIAQTINKESVYKQKINDPEAVYFTPDSFSITNDGKSDVSDELQHAIDKIKNEKNFGILFIPEGIYKISKTIYVPKAVRLIGYGKKRPMIVLGENSPGYQEADSSDKGNANYMIWFTSGVVREGRSPRDAGAGTLYSAISNIDFKTVIHRLSLSGHTLPSTVLSLMSLFILVMVKPVYLT